MCKITLAGENSIILYFGDKISPTLPAKIAQAINQLKTQLSEFIIDLTPSYTSLLVTYDLNLVNYQQFCEQVEACLKNNATSSEVTSPKLIEIPVYYGIDVGLDLACLLDQKQLDLNSFINIHSSIQYLVYAIGFSPGFAFLGEVDARIQAPRLATPRIQIPAGSVGIADNQTAIYPADSSGGWNIIGRTPIDLSLNNPNNIDKFKIGDKVKFNPISKHEFQSC